MELVFFVFRARSLLFSKHPLSTCAFKSVRKPDVCYDMAMVRDDRLWSDPLYASILAGIRRSFSLIVGEG